MLTDMLVDETPDIYSDFKNLLLVYPTDVLHMKEKNDVCVSACRRNTDTKIVGVSSGMLSLVYLQRVITPQSSPSWPDSCLDGTCRTLLR